MVVVEVGSLPPFVAREGSRLTRPLSSWVALVAAKLGSLTDRGGVLFELVVRVGCVYAKSKASSVTNQLVLNLDFARLSVKVEDDS